MTRHLAALLICLLPAEALAQVVSKPLLEETLPDLPGKAAAMSLVTLAPGAASPAHRHNAHVFVYVLEGMVEMQLAGKPLQLLSKGQTFHETPSDVHVIGRNASSTAPAQFLVFYIKNAGAPSLVPAK
ncbi:hypothetical protein CAP39_05220 [Sphingomonas sp. IBVSS1]|nr:hypothetical protein CAP39_05220 [Sphingomonas sp. IBVSS1]